MSRYRLGTAHNGLHDWYLQRVSAVVLALLLPAAFLLLLCIYNGGMNQAELWAFLHHSVVRVLHSLLALAVAVHGFTGLKMIVEDYLHKPCLRTVVAGVLAIGVGCITLWWLAMIWNWSM